MSKLAFLFPGQGSQYVGMGKDLIKQVNGPVRWSDSVQSMIRQGIDTFVEVGPGNVLTGLMRKTNREVACSPVEKPESIDTLIEKLKNN